MVSFFARNILGHLQIARNAGFFSQIRPWKNGESYRILKFRSMTGEKDADGNLLPNKKRITKLVIFSAQPVSTNSLSSLTCSIGI
ncbi:MAG: hypothetical protein ACO363_06635 [Balneolaceae bacterium]